MRIEGSPDIDYVSTSYAERSNLTVRMHTRRFTRLTNGFSKKVENHAHSVALFAMYHNFVRIHKTLRTTPAMAAKVTERLWEIGDIVGVLEAWEAAQVRRSLSGRKAMEWFSRKTSIAGTQISNWILVLAALVVILLIYSIVH